MKKDKKIINVLTVFFIPYKSDIKIFLKWMVNECHLYLQKFLLYFMKAITKIKFYLYFLQ